MKPLLKNFVLVLLAMAVGAALMLGYQRFQPATAVTTPLVASAQAAASRASLLDEDAIASIYERTSPAVVYITATGARPTLRDIPQLPEIPRLPGTPQLPRPQPSRGTGSGVIIDNQGHILTNNHVVAGATRLDVTLASGDTVQAQLLGSDPGNDLAMLKIDMDPSKLTVAELGSSQTLKPGQLAIAIGNPFGLERTITVGFVSSVGRTYSGGSSARPIRNMIQTDAAINPGNSGGPLLNSSGQVVGITTAIESPVGGSVGIGFAVPIDTAKAELQDLIAGKPVSHPWLGISGLPVSSNVAKDLGVPAEGVYVVQVQPNSPAASAGLKGATVGATQTDSQTPKGGDVILSVDGQKVSKVEDISSYLDTKKAGDKVALTVRRDGQQQQIDVTLAEWPANLDQD